MNTFFDKKSTMGNGAAPRKKPRGLYFLSSLPLHHVYDSEAQAEIARRVDIPKLPLSSETYAQTDQAWPDVEIIFSGWGLAVLDEAFLARFPKLKVIFYGAGSVRPFVTEAFWQSGIRVVSAAVANAVPVAEYTCAQIVMALKMVWQNALAIRREGRFARHVEPLGVYRRTVGLLSLGLIGKMVAERLRRYDLNVVAFDPFIAPEEAARLGVTLLPLEDVFSRADVVSCHTPWLPETERMIRGQHFEMLKQNATFINTARGAVIAEDEMIQVLQKRLDLLAILDVTYPEPPVAGSPLLNLENVILTPHIAGSTGDECRRMGHYMVAELKRYLDGQPLHHEVKEERMAISA